MPENSEHVTIQCSRAIRDHVGAQYAIAFLALVQYRKLSRDKETARMVEEQFGSFSTDGIVALSSYDM